MWHEAEDLALPGSLRGGLPGTFVLSDTMVKAFDELYTGLTSGTDVVVKSKAAYEADIATTGGQVRPLDESIVARVRKVPGVEVAEGSVFGFALILDKNGDPIHETKVTPTVIAAIVSNRRSLLASRLRSETRSIVSRPAAP